jgi:hypothetical protein
MEDSGRTTASTTVSRATHLLWHSTANPQMCTFGSHLRSTSFWFLLLLLHNVLPVSIGQIFLRNPLILHVGSKGTSRSPGSHFSLSLSYSGSSQLVSNCICICDLITTGYNKQSKEEVIDRENQVALLFDRDLRPFFLIPSDSKRFPGHICVIIQRDTSEMELLQISWGTDGQDMDSSLHFLFFAFFHG